MIKDLCLSEARQVCNFKFKEALKTSGLESFSFSGNERFRVLLSEEEICAILIYRNIAQGLVEIDFIASAPGFQRRGASQRLLSSLGGTELWLELKEDNLAALEFYKKNGFLCVGRRESYYNDGSAALNMRRKATSGLINK